MKNKIIEAVLKELGEQVAFHLWIAEDEVTSVELKKYHVAYSDCLRDVARLFKQKYMPMDEEDNLYGYVLKTDVYYNPRKLAEELRSVPAFKNFVGITDLQSNKHMYGDTYVISHEEE